MDIVFKTLLNRPPTLEEIKNLNNKDITFIKKYIKDSVEFKIFYENNINQITNIFSTILKIKVNNLKPQLFMRDFIRLKYVYNDMLEFITLKIQKIHTEYQDFYQNYLDMNKNIEPEEVIEILNNNYDVKQFICLSDEFKELCDIKIEELIL